MPLESLSKPSSWVILRRSTGEPVLETHNPLVIEHINKDKFFAMPITEYLPLLNTRGNE